MVYWALHCVHTYLKPTINNFYVLYKIATVGQHQCDIITAPFVIVLENFWQGSAKNVSGLLVNFISTKLACFQFREQNTVWLQFQVFTIPTAVFVAIGQDGHIGGYSEGVEVHMCFFAQFVVQYAFGGI